MVNYKQLINTYNKIEIYMGKSSFFPIKESCYLLCREYISS